MPLREADAPPARAVSRELVSPSTAASAAAFNLGSLVIRDYGSSESIPEMTQLLRAAYAHLARKGLRYLATYQDDLMTARRLGRGFPLVVYLEGRLVGTATLYPPRADSPVEWYRRTGVFHFGQFGVSPELQKQGIGVRLLRALEERARARGGTELACDTAEQAEHLRSWYEREGFQVVGSMKWQVTNFQSVVMSKTIVVPGS